MEPWILTYSGQHLDLVEPKVESINIEDIAVGLSRASRWNGQTREPHSVARHSLNLLKNLPPNLHLEALLHDATEAYLGDLNYPTKTLCPDYKRVEFRLDLVIRRRFGLCPIENLHVKEVDLRTAVTERRDLFLHPMEVDDPKYVDLIPYPEPTQEGWHQLDRSVFLRAFKELYREV